MRHEQEESRDQYRGFNPAFCRKVWAKRREEEVRKPVAPYVPKTERRRWNTEVRDTLAVLLLRNLTAEQIGREIGKTKSAVIGIVNRDPILKQIGFAATRPSQHRGGVEC